MIQTTLWQLLGVTPPDQEVPVSKLLRREQRDGYVLEELEFYNGAGEPVRAYCFLPSPHEGAGLPGVLYCHWHGEQYGIGKEEMLLTTAVPEPPGPALAREGFVTLGIDAPCFGARNGSGPLGPQPMYAAGEAAASKWHLWHGRTLWGAMLHDDLLALRLLLARPEVDSARVGVTGVSMGSTRAWWLMALEERLAAASCTACMTRCQDLIESGKLNAHGIYYYVPGLLRHFDHEAIMAAAAPRPMLFQTGDQDEGSPISGVRKLEREVAKAYEALGAAEKFQSIVYPGVGHVCLPEMWQRTVAWLERWLK